MPPLNSQQQEAGEAERDLPGGGDPSWGGDSRAVHIPLSMGSEAAEAKHRFPIKRVYLAPALLTLKQEGLKVNSLSIPYCQLIHHSTGAGAAKVSLPQPPWVWKGDQKDAVLTSAYPSRAHIARL